MIPEAPFLKPACFPTCSHAAAHPCLWFYSIPWVSWSQQSVSVGADQGLCKELASFYCRQSKKKSFWGSPSRIFHFPRTTTCFAVSGLPSLHLMPPPKQIYCLFWSFSPLGKETGLGQVAGCGLGMKGELGGFRTEGAEASGARVGPGARCSNAL